MYQPHQYKCIAMWGFDLGSYPYYIQQQQMEASKDEAPLTAVYKNGDEWVLLEDVQNKSVRDSMIRNLSILAAANS